MTEEPKCRDCKWLTGKKNIRGIECMHPKNQEKWNKAKTLWMGELRKDSARYKQGSALACKKFEAKESEHMGRYIDADALKEWIDEYVSVFKKSDTREIKGYIEHQPTIDAVSVVRCKECKYGEYREDFDDYECHSSGCGLVYDADFFCADGERSRR